MYKVEISYREYAGELITELFERLERFVNEENCKVEDVVIHHGHGIWIAHIYYHELEEEKIDV